MERKQEGKAPNSFLTFGSSLAPSGTSWCHSIILFCFSHLPLETEKVFESVCGCSWTVGIFTPRLIRVHLLFIWDFFPLHIIYLWCQQRFPGARRFSNTVGVGRTKLPHANGEREELMDQSQNNSKPSCCWQRVTELPGIYSKCCFSSFLSSSAAHIKRMHDFLRQHFKYFSYFLLFHFAFPIFVCVSKLGFFFGESCEVSTKVIGSALLAREIGEKWNKKVLSWHDWPHISWAELFQWRF